MHKSTVSTKFKLAWSMKPGSMAVLSVLLNSYVSYFATNFMMIPVATVGIVFMVSKVFDGFTDIIAGYLIDHTHTKLGKARPYELGILGYWGCTVVLFCAPVMGQTASIIYLFMTYVLIQSVFYTMISCNDPVYLANTGVSSEQAVGLSAFSGVVTMLFSLFGAVFVPQLVASIGDTREGWRIISIALAIPMMILGILRFIFIKETTDAQNHENGISFKESVGLLVHNKYILLFALYMLIANIAAGLTTNVNAYYYKYIFGDIGAASYGAVSVVSILLATVLIPVLSKRIGFQKSIRIMMLISAVGYLVRLVNIHSVFFLILSCLLSGIGINTFYMFVNVYLMECMDYGEWKNGKRGEGIISCANGVACKVGTALGLGLSGILMGMSGFDAKLAVQVTSANTMIITLVTILPALMCLLLFITLHFYKLEGMMPQIKADLEKS